MISTVKIGISNIIESQTRSSSCSGIPIYIFEINNFCHGNIVTVIPRFVVGGPVSDWDIGTHYNYFPNLLCTSNLNPCVCMQHTGLSFFNETIIMLYHIPATYMSMRPTACIQISICIGM